MNNSELLTIDFEEAQNECAYYCSEDGCCRGHPAGYPQSITINGVTFTVNMDRVPRLDESDEQMHLLESLKGVIYLKQYPILVSGGRMDDDELREFTKGDVPK